MNIIEPKSTLEPTRQPTEPNAFNPKKLLFLIPIIIGLGLLFVSSLGGVGLFANSTPEWLTHIIDAIRNACTDKIFLPMMVVGGVLGIGAIVGGIYGMTKSNTDNEKPIEIKNDIKSEKPIEIKYKKIKFPKIEASIDIEHIQMKSIPRKEIPKLFEGKNYLYGMDESGKRRILFMHEGLICVSKPDHRCRNWLMRNWYSNKESKIIRYTTRIVKTQILPLLEGKKYLYGMDESGNSGILFIHEGNFKCESNPKNFKKCRAWLNKNGYALIQRYGKAQPLHYKKDE